MHRLRLTETAHRDLRRLLGHVRQRARRAISGLAEQPRPPDARELRELPGRYRIRLDTWRVVYHIDDEAEVVLILCLRRTRGPETYRDLE